MQAPFGGEGTVDVLNLKCEPLMTAPCSHEPGVLPAYHMNKEHWITILLDSPLPPRDHPQLTGFEL